MNVEAVLDRHIFTRCSVDWERTVPRWTRKRIIVGKDLVLFNASDVDERQVCAHFC